MTGTNAFKLILFFLMPTLSALQDLHNKEDAFHEKMQHECDAKAPVPTLEKVVGSKRREKGKKEERPPRVKPFSLKKLVRFFSKPESKREGAALPRKQMSEGMADYAGMFITMCCHSGDVTMVTSSFPPPLPQTKLVLQLL